MAVSRRGTIRCLLFGLVVSVLFTLAAMLFLAAALLFFHIDDGLLRALNQAIKLIAIVLGVCCAVPRGGERGLATGTVLSLLYSVSGCVLYALLGGKLDFASFLGELLLGCAAGAVTGVIRANMRPKKRRISRSVHG